MEKVTVKDLNPNPFRADLGGYDDDQIARIIESCKMSDFGIGMRFEVRKNDKDKLELVFGHHRWKALEKHYGKNHPVEVIIRNYDDNTMWVEMCRENLTRESTWFNRMTVYVATKKRLELTGVEALDTRDSRGRINKATTSQGIGGRQVAEALSKDGLTVSKDEVIKTLTIAEGLNPELLSKVKRTDNISKDDAKDAVPLRTAEALAKIYPHSEDPENPAKQKKLAKALKGSREQRIESQRKLLTQYAKLPETDQEKILNGDLDIADAKLAKYKKTPPDLGVDKNIEAVITNMAGQELALTADTFLKLLKKNELEDFEVKGQLLIKAIFKEIEAELKNWR